MSVPPTKHEIMAQPSLLPDDSHPVPVSETIHTVSIKTENKGAVTPAPEESPDIDECSYSANGLIMDITPEAQTGDTYEHNPQNYANVGSPLNQTAEAHDIVIPEAFLVDIPPAEVAEIPSAEIVVPDKYSWTLTIAGKKIHIGVFLFILLIIAVIVGVLLNAGQSKMDSQANRIDKDYGPPGDLTYETSTSPTVPSLSSPEAAEQVKLPSTDTAESAPSKPVATEQAVTKPTTSEEPFFDELMTDEQTSEPSTQQPTKSPVTDEPTPSPVDSVHKPVATEQAVTKPTTSEEPFFDELMSDEQTSEPSTQQPTESPVTNEPTPSPVDSVPLWMQNLDSPAIEWIEAHNSRREFYHELYGETFVPLVWSTSLAEEAEAWVEENKPGTSCMIAAQGRDDVGQSFSSYWSAQSDVEYSPEYWLMEWVDDEADLEWDENRRFTQAIWRASKYLGCAYSVYEYTEAESDIAAYCHLASCNYIRKGNCDMYSVEDWREPMLKDDTNCGDKCPSEGCYWTAWSTKRMLK